MEKEKVIVVGAKGRMGSEVCKILQNEFEVIEIDMENSLKSEINAKLIIDFANAETSVSSAKYAALENIPIIIGSTGQSKNELNEVEKCSKLVPVLLCRNFSIGIFLEKEISKLILNYVHGADITIFEKHHKMKKDSPSGTALEIQKCIESKVHKKAPILSERGGKEIGTHQVDFYFGDELISVSHSAFSREAFSRGVLIAAKFMIQTKVPKMYEFDEILKKSL